MGIVTVSATNAAETAALLKQALAKERAFLQLGVEKTRARIQHFEHRYGMTLAQLLEHEQTIDHTDLAEWEGETEILRRLMRKVENLDALEICT